MISGSGIFQILLIALTTRYIHWQVYSVRHRLQRGICCLLYGIRIEIDNSSKSVPSAFCLLSNGFKWTIRIYNFLKSGFYNINVNAVCFFKYGLCPAVYIDKAMRQFNHRALSIQQRRYRMFYKVLRLFWYTISDTCDLT